MSTATPQVSVIVPTHNRVRMLPLTLRTVLWQHSVDLELLVIDDGSREDVSRVVDRIDDRRIRVLRQEPAQGVSRARNRGVAEARGSWIAFLDDDDLWAPDKLTSQLRVAEEQNRSWAYVGAVNITEDLRLLGGAPPAEPAQVVSALPGANLIPGGCSGVVVRRELLPSEPFDPALSTFADWDLWIRLSRRAMPAGVGRPLVGYRVHGSNMSQDASGKFAELAVIEKRYGGPIDWVRFYRHLARIAMRGSRHRDALRHYVHAATKDRPYRTGDFVPDLLEVAQGVGHRLRHRARRALTGTRAPARAARPGRRYTAEWAWVEQAQTWLDQAAEYLPQHDRRDV